MINEDGLAGAYASDAIGSAVWYYALRPGEEAPTKIGKGQVGAILPANRFFKKWGVVYFNDDQELVERIKKKKTKLRSIQEMEEVLNLYSDWKGVAQPLPKAKK